MKAWLREHITGVTALAVFQTKNSDCLGRWVLGWVQSLCYGNLAEYLNMWYSVRRADNLIITGPHSGAVEDDSVPGVPASVGVSSCLQPVRCAALLGRIQK
jgi:hypothetical protein